MEAMMCEQYWKWRAERLEAAATDVLSAFEPASVVHIGSSHYKYSSAWPTHTRNPVQRLREALAPQSEATDEGRVEVCPECASVKLEWGLYARQNADSVDGRVRMSEVEPLLIQSCRECSETIRVVRDDDVNNYIERQPVRGEAGEESGGDHE